MRTRYQHHLPMREIIPLVHAEMRRWERFERVVMGTGGAPPGRGGPTELASGGGHLGSRYVTDSGTRVDGIQIPVNAASGEEGGDGAVR